MKVKVQTVKISNREQSRRINLVGSGSKNKASLPRDSEQVSTQTMPKVPRTPSNEGQVPTASQTPQAQSSELLLVGMEGRLGSKIDATNQKVERALTLVALEDLKIKVAATEENMENG